MIWPTRPKGNEIVLKFKSAIASLKQVVNMIYVGKSSIEGDGVYTSDEISKNSIIGIAFSRCNNSGMADKDFVVYKLGRYVNHSDCPNLTFKIISGNIYYISIKQIHVKEELTINYTQLPIDGDLSFLIFSNF